MKTFQQVLERTKDRPIYEVGSEEVTVPRDDPVPVEAAEAEAERRRCRPRICSSSSVRAGRMICLFLAILELVKRQAVVLTQTDAFGDIGLEAGPGIDEARSDEQMSAIEQEYK